MAEKVVRDDPIMQLIFHEWGFATRIAEELKISHQSIQAWKRVPPERVLAIAEIIGKTPEEIRPDIFDKRKGRWVPKKSRKRRKASKRSNSNEQNTRQA